MPDTTWTDPEGNVWTIVGTGSTWLPGQGLQLPGTTAGGQVVGPTGLGPTIAANGFDVRCRLQMPVSGGSGYNAWWISLSAAGGQLTFRLNCGSSTAGAAGTCNVMMYNSASVAAFNTGMTNAQLNGPGAGDWVTVRFTWNPATNQTVGFISADNGATWTQKVAVTPAAFAPMSAASHVLATNAFAAAIGWLDLRTFAGTPLASVDLTWPWGVPRVTSMTPAQGIAGTQVTLAGTSLAGTTGVDFGGTATTPGTAAQIVSTSATQLVFNAPAGLLGGAAVWVRNPAGDTNAGTFTYVGLAPTQGPAGTTVTITGTGLAGVTTVNFGTEQATPTEATATTVTVDSPAGLPVGQAVNVTLGPGAIPAGTFTTIPGVGGYSPPAGYGGTVVTIVGTDLENTTGVMVGGPGDRWQIPAEIVSVTDSQVVIVMPYGFTSGSPTLYLQPGNIPLGPFEYARPAPAAPECRRRAWLVLGGRSVDLEDPDGLWVCSELNIGWPAIREVVDNRPDFDGVVDRTKLFGARAVTANIVAGEGGRSTPDDIARMFGPYLVPSVRPELHWTLDTPGDTYAERVLTLRAADLSAPIAGPWTREIQLGWTAPDPVIRDATWQTEVARPAWGTGGATLRFPITFPITFAGAASGGAQSDAELISPGDVPVYPQIRCWGPITGPQLTVTAYPPGEPVQAWALNFAPSFSIAAGHYVDVDCAAHSIVADDGTHLEGRIVWASSQWPVALPGGVENRVSYVGTSTDAITQAVITWRDGWVAP